MAICKEEECEGTPVEENVGEGNVLRNRDTIYIIHRDISLEHLGLVHEGENGECWCSPYVADETTMEVLSMQEYELLRRVSWH